MHVEIIIPDWIRNGEVTVRLTELNPVATEALIETLRDAMPADDDRVRLLLDLWDALTE
jgi:hypothetical protein